MNPDDKLKNLSQAPDAPFAITLAPIRYMGKNFYASGQVSKRGDAMLATGLVGREVDMKLAQECAWQCAVNVLESVQKEIGSLDKIEYVVRLGIYVASADNFSEQHLVAHGASQVILNVFGPERGSHTRTAIGVKSLPLNSPVEVDAIFRDKELIQKLFKGGLVADGTGSALARVDVAVKDGQIVDVGNLDVSAEEVIDITNLILAPGFIDIHTHSDLTLLSNPLAQSKIRQGITTEVIGNCGFGVAPNPVGEASDLLRAAVAYLDLDPSIKWDWSDLAGYLKVLEKSGTSVNVATLVGHIPIHASVVGFGKEPATPAEIIQMQELLRENMAAGAFGFSTGLNYSPVSYASQEELIGLANVVKEYDGIFACHMREYGDDLMKSMNELLSITRATGVRTQISHLVTFGKRNWGSVARALELIDQANQDGFEVDADVYPYIAGNCPLTQLLPYWAQEGGDTVMRDRMKDKTARPKIISHWIESEVIWSNIQIANVIPGREDLIGRKISDIAESLSIPADILALDLLGDMGNALGIIAFGRAESDVNSVYAHSRSIVGSDGQSLDPNGATGSGSPHPRSYGCYPRLIHGYTGASGISLERAIHISTQAAANKLHLKDRGSIKIGNKADLVIFNPREIRDLATYVQPQQYPIGIPHVIVNGEFAIKDGSHTGKLSGEIIRF